MVDLKLNNQQNKKMPVTRTWYLDDRPLESFETGDHFRHQAYVAVLLRTIKELSPPFTVGIFGSWGVGKTSISNELRHSIKRAKETRNVPVVSIDVWKYEGDSLRRQFLLDVQETLKSGKVLPKNSDIVGHLYRERTREIETEPRFSWHRLKSLAPFLLISLIVTFGALWLFLLLGVSAPLQALALSLVVPILLLLIPEFTRKVVLQQRSTETEPRFFSPEQFEQAFGNMVSEAKCAKMVILIDNLDRCSHERVVETLGVVKTYLEPKGKKCIFVIPCDDAAIRQHLKMAYQVLAEPGSKIDLEKYADEYLRKFFNISIRIGHFIETEIEPYIAALLNQIKLTEKMSDDDLTRMVQLIGAGCTETPRRIKQFLNNLTAKYLLVKDREGQPSPLISPPISDSLLFLTKVSIIEAKFPNQFAEFMVDDNLYSEVASALEQDVDVSDKAKEILNNAELRQFLLATKHVTVQNPKAFFHLKQSPQEAIIPNYSEFWIAVRAGDRALVQSLFDKGDDQVNTARVEDICSQIRANVSKGYYDYAVKIIDVACAIAHKVPQLTVMLARLAIDTLVSYSGVRQRLSSLKPDEVFSLIPSATENDSRVVLNEYINLYSLDPETTQLEGVDMYALQLSIAEAMVRNLDLFTRSQLEKVRGVALNVKSLSPSLLKIISSTNGAKSDLVSPLLVSKSIEQLKVEEISAFAQSEESQAQHFQLIEFILRCQDLADNDVGELWIKKCTELLELATKENNPRLEEYTNRCIDESESLWSKGSTESVDRLARLLRERYPQANADRRLDIVLTLSRMQKSCSSGEQSQSKGIILKQFIQSEPPEHVARFLVIQADKNYETLPYNQEAFNNLAQRVVSEESEDTKRKILKSLLSINGSKGIDILLTLLVSLASPPRLQAAAPLIREMSVEFPKGPQGKALVAPLLGDILHQAHGQVPIAQRKTALELAIDLKEFHTKKLQEEFDNIVAELLTSTEVPLKELGLDTITSTKNKGVLTEERRKAILQQVATWITKQRPQPPDEQTMNELALIIEGKEDILSGDLRSGMIEYLRVIASPQNSPGHRTRALRHLSSFANIPRDILEGLIPELVGYAERERDPNIRNEIEESLLVLRARNMPLDRELWEDLYRYVRAVQTDPDSDRQQHGRELNQRMRQITKKAKKEAGLEEELEEE